MKLTILVDPTDATPTHYNWSPEWLRRPKKLKKILYKYTLFGWIIGPHSSILLLHYMYMYKINLNVKLNETKFSLLAHSTHHGKLHETLFFVVISMIKIAAVASKIHNIAWNNIHLMLPDCSSSLNLLCLRKMHSPSEEYVFNISIIQKKIYGIWKAVTDLKQAS